MIIKCNNTGTATDDTYYQWYIDDMLVDDTDNGVLIGHPGQTSTGSILLFDNYIWPSNNVKVTCRATIPEVVSVNKSLVITIDGFLTSTEFTTMPNKQSPVTNTPAYNPLTLITISNIYLFILFIYLFISQYFNRVTYTT